MCVCVYWVFDLVCEHLDLSYLLDPYFTVKINGDFVFTQRIVPWPQSTVSSTVNHPVSLSFFLKCHLLDGNIR